MFRLAILLGFIFAIVSAFAETLQGRVVSVADGDTITVLDSGRHTYRIRLGGIDAPEKRQAYGQVSKDHLAQAVFNKSVTIEFDKHDRYGRIVGKVLLGNRDICLEQIQAGLAWHYKRYENEQTQEDRGRYAFAEQEARAKGVGLWRDANAIPPWAWRHLGDRRR